MFNMRLRRKIIDLETQLKLSPKPNEYLEELGRQTCLWALNGYAMQDEAHLPKGKNCVLFINGSYERAAKELGRDNEKWNRLKKMDKSP